MIYFDAAYVAKFYLDEPDSERVRSVGDNAGEVACCVHGRIEVISVFHRKMRERAFAPKVFAVVCDQFDTDCEALVWEWLPISAALIADLSLPTRCISAVRPSRGSRRSTRTIATSLPPRRTSGCSASVYSA
jgi:hypothetical protein